MTYNLNDVIAQVAAIHLDPDRLKYPHLFETWIIDNSKLNNHQCSYVPDDSRNNHPYQYIGNLAKSIAKSNQGIGERERYEAVAGRHKPVSESFLKGSGWTTPNGKPRRYVRPKVTYIEPDIWLDTDTGELMTKTDFRKENKRLPMAKSISMRMLETVGKVNSCKPSEREFISYILNMRNRRGGLVEDLVTLVDRWIGFKHPEIADANKARKRKSLISILEINKIMANSQTLVRDLQILGNPTKQEIIEEGAKVYTIIDIRAKPGCGVLANTQVGMVGSATGAL